MRKLSIALKFFPLILASIKAAEEVVPGKGEGKAKLDFVLGIADAAYTAEQTIVEGIKRDEFQAAVTSVVGHTVLRLNSTGQFQNAAA